jgi:hypothetical protein
MKKQLFTLPLMLVAALMLMLSACKKDDNTDDSVSAEDHANVSNSLNASTDDAANIAGGIQTLSGKTDGYISICGATIDSSQKSSGIITVTYAAAGCGNGINRTGTVTLTLQNYVSGTRWKDAGAVLQIDYNNLLITNVVTGAHITLNGTHYLTNETGGLAWRIMDGLDVGTVTHRHTATNFTLTFADGSVRTWSVNRLRTFTNNGSVKTVTVSSDHTENGVANADAWGTNRKGDAFVNAIITPISSNSTCGYYHPTVGEFTHKVANRMVDILYGVDANGNPVSGTNCAYGLKITYTKNTLTKTKIVSYWF